MTLFAAAAVAIIVAAAAEIALPGRDAYHTGWFGAGLVALVAIVVAAARAQFGQTRSIRARAGIVAVAFGAAVAGVAGAASGLLAPDNRTIVAAPGQRVQVADVGGSLVFPIAGTDAVSAGDVVLERPNRAALTIAGSGRNTGTFVLRPILRNVVYVDARDARGGLLTVTQPSGSSFLSPVLLMQQQQTIAGLNVPFDSFAVPAAHRLVKAVLFSSQEAAMMHGLGAGAGAAVLFAVDDENDRPLPHAIAAARSGVSLDAGGLRLRGIVFSYPAVELVAVPSLAAVIAGGLLVFGGLIARGRNHNAVGR